MTGTALLQTLAVCADCEETITVEVRKGLDGENLCMECFENADLIVCENCSETHARDDCRENPDGALWCNECLDDACHCCENCESEVWSDDLIEITGVERRNGRPLAMYWCDSCVTRHAFPCDECGSVYSNDHSNSVANGDIVCNTCYDESYFTCDGCDMVHHLEARTDSDYESLCEDCGPNGLNFRPSGFQDLTKCIDDLGSKRCYGLELETDECDGYSELQDGGAWGAKDDPTVLGKEFYSAVLSGDEGLQAIRDWGELAGRNNWVATSDAGYHLHLDMRGERGDALYAIAYAYRATQEVWATFVPHLRTKSSYCAPCHWTCDDFPADTRTGFRRWAHKRSRYMWFNTCSYDLLTTFELRLHEGTCDTEAIINWVKAHTRFADWASGKGFAGVKEALAGLDEKALAELIGREAWKDEALCDYYAKKAATR